MKYIVSSCPLGNYEGKIEYITSENPDWLANSYAKARLIDGWELLSVELKEKANGKLLYRAVYKMPINNIREQIINDFSVIPYGN